MPPWIRLGAGSYNTAYRDEARTRVLKVQHDASDKTDLPIRSVRLWNEINGEFPPPAYLASTEVGNGWVCPYVEGVQASDKEMAEALLNIYTRTGRIVVDATAPKNFVRTPGGQVVCVDIGMALQMQQRDEIRLRELGTRRMSVVSLDVWTRLKDAYTPFFRQCRLTHPNTVETVKALLFIQSNRPDIFDVGFLKSNSALVSRLAQAYDIERARPSSPDVDLVLGDLDRVTPEQPIVIADEVLEARHELRNARPIHLGNIKESCVVELDRYINSRGTIRVDGSFSPSWITFLFRNQGLTAQKVFAAQELTETIRDAKSYDELKQVLREKLDDEVLTKSNFTSGLASRLLNCLTIIEKGEFQEPSEHEEMSP